MANQSSYKLTPIHRASIKDLALEQLKQYIVASDLTPGQRLPSERELAEQLGVGRNSVREALKVLEAVGVVTSRIGEGTFITAQTGASFGRMLGFGLAAWGGSIMEILEARQMIEVEAARTAAAKADDDDLAQLEAELLQMEAVQEFSPTYLKADMNFHRLIGQATHNAIVAQIMADIIDLLEETLAEAHTDELPITAEGTGSHRALFAAIQQRDATLVEQLMRQHLQFSIELWQILISLGAAKQ
ncbi:MAG: FadR family transcriptional regulator [Caldilineaceae bacterium]|nr:FadR family transcriptional regulator [Caldilineaceae bacterium]